MNKFIIKYLRIWWIPILTYIVLQIIYIIGLLSGSRFVFKLFPFLLVPVAISIAISSVIIFSKNKWYIAIGQAILGLIIVLSFYVLFYPRDLFFSHIGIPVGIEYKTPIDFKTQYEVDSIMSLKKQNREFLLANYGQGGMYKTFIWLNSNEDGQIYLKAFEEKGNIELSHERLKDKTTTKVHKNQLRCYSQEFTIYEGVWGSYYVGRLEVWFNPLVGDDYKLMENVYRIEGWIR